MSKSFKTWDQFADEAKIEPYVMPVKDEDPFTFTCPSGAALMHIMRGIRTGDMELILTYLAGDQWPRMIEKFGDVGHKALSAIAEELLDYFDLYEPVKLTGPGGGTVTAKRPTEIQGLLNQGYRIAGEGPASHI